LLKIEVVGGNYMPAELLEEPVEVEEMPREIPKAFATDAVEKEPAMAKSLWRKVFESHEEFLGCTPD
jgi:hypothetical protein